MDNYSKTMLTVIAIFLGAITFKLWQPAPPAKNAMDDFVSSAELERVGKLPEEERKAASKEISGKIPVVRVAYPVTVSGTVDVENVESTVSVYVQDRIIPRTFLPSRK